MICKYEIIFGFSVYEFEYQFRDAFEQRKPSYTYLQN